VSGSSLVPVSGHFGQLQSLCQISKINTPGAKFRYQPSFANDQNWLFILNPTPVISTPNPNAGSWLWPPEFTAIPTRGASYQLTIKVNGYVGVIGWVSTTPYQWYQVSVTEAALPIVGYIAYDPNTPIFFSDCDTKSPPPQSIPPPQFYPQNVVQFIYAPA